MDNQTLFNNLRESLLEKIGEWLDSEEIKTEEVLDGIFATPKEDCELHVKMADAAMKVYSQDRELTLNQ